jgi:hypothetical protein
MNNWDKYRANKAKADAGQNYRQTANGKGDIDRSTHLDTYQLGSKLIDLAASHGKDSDEYKECYDLWKAACRRSAGI